MTRLISRARSDERGVTIFEMVVTVSVLSIAIIALLSSLERATTTAGFAERRNRALDELRIMAANFGKDVRQGTQAITVSPTNFSFDTYVDGEVHNVTWRAVTGGDEDRLERVVDGTLIVTYVVDLTTTAVFSYFGETDPAQVNRVRLALATQPDDRYQPVGLSTELEMRNVG